MRAWYAYLKASAVGACHRRRRCRHRHRDSYLQALAVDASHQSDFAASNQLTYLKHAFRAARNAAGWNQASLPPPSVQNADWCFAVGVATWACGSVSRCAQRFRKQQLLQVLTNRHGNQTSTQLFVWNDTLFVRLGDGRAFVRNH